MNSCILMATIVQEPQLRYTPEQTPLAEMRLEIPGLRAEDPPATLKAVGWGNLAQEIQQNYHEGDRVIVEGRLSMNTVPLEGYKEKRAELTVQKIHSLNNGATISSSAMSTATARNNAELGSDEYATPTRTPVTQQTSRSRAIEEEKASTAGVRPQSAPPVSVPQSTTPQVKNYPVSSPVEVDVDDIPF